VHGAYDKIFERLELSDKTYYTFASGGTFSKYSHEFQVLLVEGEDHIYISEDAEKKGERIAINKEIFEEGKTKCPVTGGTAFREERASEAGNIFQLGTKFSEPFNLQYTDQNGKMYPIPMGCYGMGVSRLMGILVEAFADDHGMRWPESVAPVDLHIVPIAKEASDASYKEAEKVYKAAIKSGKTALFDDRLGASVGAKLSDADLIGAPTRIVVSPKTLDEKSVEKKDRMTGKIEMVPIGSL
ncbi:MAG: His/Gly/Thr/Pro-type tRNA ligase C-terminal domain-containing protein, partial [Candidatus Peribacteraceae bacterium]|jgi:prolyl-tRNA synthetase|nr:His/Gly/Thr/Pro-type tRNA ligase C-terminal domain-containing protein [Candidatus Peribacteraceae bacterium]